MTVYFRYRVESLGSKLKGAMRSRQERTKYCFTFSWKKVHCACNERVTVAPAKGAYEAQSPSATEQTIRNTMKSLALGLERLSN